MFASAAYNRHDQLRGNRRNGVQAYLLWCPRDRQIHWFCLEAGEYPSLPADTEGIIGSRHFPGLWLAPEALLVHELGTVLRGLQQGMATPEH
ncbi:Uma2 family endonuclease [Thermosynechococcus sp. OHK43]|uniref:Uma2 family endonuclease n=1 Tax=Thermosynechococcus sp. OHK43 TaxID=2763133 RepID=UPI0025F74C3E|nr:Uma2 family endonuclease [Thermosynechococcus sp. OHK43]